MVKDIFTGYLEKNYILSRVGCGGGDASTTATTVTVAREGGGGGGGGGEGPQQTFWSVSTELF